MNILRIRNKSLILHKVFIFGSLVNFKSDGRVGCETSSVFRIKAKSEAHSPDFSHFSEFITPIFSHFSQLMAYLCCDSCCISDSVCRVITPSDSLRRTVRGKMQTTSVRCHHIGSLPPRYPDLCQASWRYVCQGGQPHERMS